MLNNKDKLVVIKSNKLIDAKYKLNLIELKIILFMMSFIDLNDDDFKIYRINITDFINLVGIQDKSSYRKIAQITKDLMKKVIEINEPDRLLQVNWLASADYFHTKGYVELEFSQKLKPFLLKLKEHFTMYKLQNTIQLKSIYSIRIYELLKQYETIGKRLLNVLKLRNMLGIDVEEYKLYADFKKKVIIVAQEELLEKTDISFEFIEIKNCRKVEAIEFIINKKNKDIKLLNESSLVKILQDEFELTEQISNEIIEAYDENYIFEKINIIRQREIKTKINNKIGYLLSALKNDYKINKNNILDDKENELKENKLLEDFLSFIPEEHRLKKTIKVLLLKYNKKYNEEYVKDNIIYTNMNSTKKGGYRAYLEKSLKENWGNGYYFDYKNMQNLEDKEYNEIYDNILKNIDKVDYFGLEVSKYITKMSIEDKKKLMSYAIDTIDETGKNNMHCIMAQMRSVIYDKINKTNQFKNCPV